MSIISGSITPSEKKNGINSHFFNPEMTSKPDGWCNISQQQYNEQNPFPFVVQDNFLEPSFALNLQNEILNIPPENWDRYENPFEKKYTLRDKYAFPPLLTQLFNELTCDEFVKQLSEIVGRPLLLDTTRNFWGVHLFEEGDKLDIHVDAGIHPSLSLKKEITFGIYLSKNWAEDNGCQLELWEGESCVYGRGNGGFPQLHKKTHSVSPLFNRMIMFSCDDYSWHGSPTPNTPTTCSLFPERIFVTLSYLTEFDTPPRPKYQNLRKKAFFVDMPTDPQNDKKDLMRILRADPERFKEIYNVTSNGV